MRDPLFRLAGPSLLVALSLVIGCTREAAKPAPTKPPEVIVTLPVTQEVTDYEIFTGQTEAIASVTVRARVTGYLNQTFFKEGADVKEKDLLFEIDPRPYQAELEKAKGQLALAEAQHVKADRVFARISKLRGSAASQEDFDNAFADRGVAEAGVQSAKAAVEAAQLNLTFTKVTAPISGRISRRRVDPGNLVKADDTALVDIVSLDPMYAYFDVDERTVLRIRRLIQEGKVQSAREVEIPVTLALSDQEEFTIGGTIKLVDNKVNPQTGTLRVWGIFPNPKRFLAPNFFVRVRVPVGPPHSAILIKERALGADQDRNFVYVVNDNNEVVYRPVTIGALHDKLRVINSGIRPGERIIVGGLQRVRPGGRVDPKEAEKDSAVPRATPPLVTKNPP